MKYAICVLTLIVSTLLGTEKKTVCLNMIVKDEAQVIQACLSSVKPLIDYWVIVDTGSSDQTQALIRECLADIPGELHEKPWVDFAHNRNEALALAKNKGDYLLLIDADEVLQYDSGFSLPALEKDLYYIPVCQIGSVKLKRNGLINNHLNWKWTGVLHEILTCSDWTTQETLQGIVNLCNTHPDGVSGRSQVSQEEKYLRDAKMLERALEKEPGNSRYVYYLGVSYSAAGKYQEALAAFEKRASMPSADDQETYLALYNLGLMKERLGDPEGAIKTFMKAYILRPIRAEPIFQCAKIYRKAGNLPLGYFFSKMALSIPYPKEEFCIEYTVYDYALLIEFANCALLLEKFDEGLDACLKLLARPDLPEEYKGSVEANRKLAAQKISHLQVSASTSVMSPR